MDWIDWVTAIGAVFVVIAAVLYPINGRNNKDGDR
jgi:hypothetical protein